MDTNQYSRVGCILNYLIINFKTQNMETINLSLQNNDLYKGCEINEVAGRQNLVTPITDAVNIVGRNINNMGLCGEEITLTGPMAVWSYLVVFHAIVHRFNRVYYNDGRNPAVLVAAHGN